MDNKRRNDITVKEGRPPLTRADIFDDKLYLCKVRFNIYVDGYSEPCVLDEPYLIKAINEVSANSQAWNQALLEAASIEVLMEDPNSLVYSHTFEVISVEPYKE